MPSPDLSESPLGYKNATQIKAQIEPLWFGHGGRRIQPRGCIMVGEAAEPPWARARREKRSAHKAMHREGDAEVLADG